MALSEGHTPFQNLRISELEKVFKGHLAQAALSTFYRHLLIWKLWPSTKLQRGCLGLGQADKPALSPTLLLTSARLPEFKEGMWRLRGRVTQPFNRDTAHNGKIWEFQRERKPERPRQLPRRESQLRTNPRAKKKPWGGWKNPSPGRGLLYALRVKRSWLSKGAPPPAGPLQKEFFFFCRGSANFLLPLSQGSEPPLGRSGRTPRLGSHCGSLPGAGTDLLGKYHSFDNSCLTSLLGFFPYTLRKRSSSSLCPQIQTLFFCGGLHGIPISNTNSWNNTFLNRWQTKFFKKESFPPTPLNLSKSFVNTDIQKQNYFRLKQKHFMIKVSFKQNGLCKWKTIKH